MTLSKFTQQPTNKEVVDTINDIIDTMGSTSGANIDLSNLSATGEAKFVNTSGDTMTGNLELDDSVFLIKDTDYSYNQTTAPSSDIIVGNITVQDQNGNMAGTLRTIHNTYNNLITGIYVNRSVGGTQKTATVLAYVDASGNPHSQFSQTDCCNGAVTTFNSTVVSGLNVKNSSNTSAPYTLALPSDGQAYMVLVSGTGTTGSSSGNYVRLGVYSDAMPAYASLCSARTRTSSAVNCSGNAWIKVSSNHKIYIARDADWTGTVNLETKLYYRIGTNA